jgi:hypothetical protein
MLKHELPKQAVHSIVFDQEGAGEAGWFVYLKDGWSFDPGADYDNCTFIGVANKEDAMSLMAYKV